MGTRKQRQRRPEQPGTANLPGGQDPKPTPHSSGTERALKALAGSAMGRPRSDAAQTKAKWEFRKKNPLEIRPGPMPAETRPRTGMATAMNWRDGGWHPANTLIHRHMVGHNRTTRGVSEQYAKSLGHPMKPLPRARPKLVLQNYGPTLGLRALGTIDLITQKSNGKPVEEKVWVWRGVDVPFDMIVDPSVAHQYVVPEASPLRSLQDNSTINVAPNPIPGHVPAAYSSTRRDNVSQDYVLSMPYRPAERNESYVQDFNATFAHGQLAVGPGTDSGTVQSISTWQPERNPGYGQPSNFASTQGQGWTPSYADYGQPPTSAFASGQNLTPHGYHHNHGQPSASTSFPGQNLVGYFDDGQSQAPSFPMPLQPEPTPDINFRLAFQNEISGSFQELDVATQTDPSVHSQTTQVLGYSPLPTVTGNEVPYQDFGLGAQPNNLRSLNGLNSEDNSSAWAEAGINRSPSGAADTASVQTEIQFDVESFIDALGPQNPDYETPGSDA